jgi:hypothetical protein
MKTFWSLSLFAYVVLLNVRPASAQDTPKSITLIGQPDFSAKDILKKLDKGCPNVSIINDVAKGDYTLEAVKSKRVLNKTFDLTLFDREGRIVVGASNDNLGDSVKDVCRAIKTSVMVEVVDSHNLTQSVDARGNTSGGVVGTIVNGTTGRRTNTDASTIYIVVNGEHALLDCYERSKGCATIGPGKYYGQVKNGSIWVNYEMPLTHKPVRNHYVIRGSW